LEGVKMMYVSESEYASSIESYGISEADLTRRLLWQLTLLRFIDYRFRPGIQIPDADVQTYYRQQVSDWERRGVVPIPSLQDSRDQIEEILTQERIDQALDQWMGDTRKQVTIRYRDKTLADRDETLTDRDDSLK
jgi:peptidyl-prolyl cis-trans isomerase SurA